MLLLSVDDMSAYLFYCELCQHLPHKKLASVLLAASSLRLGDIAIDAATRTRWNREENNTEWSSSKFRPRRHRPCGNQSMSWFTDFLLLGITDKWRRYFVSSVTPSWFWFSVFWQVRTPC